jgi:septal ring factor EnvC (AmiA/AmiB activator)
VVWLFFCVSYSALVIATPERMAVDVIPVQVAPKRAALAAAQESLDKTLGELASAQSRLAAVQEKIATLEAQYEEATTKKATLAAQVRASAFSAARLQAACQHIQHCVAAQAGIGNSTVQRGIPPRPLSMAAKHCCLSTAGG